MDQEFPSWKEKDGSIKGLTKEKNDRDNILGVLIVDKRDLKVLDQQNINNIQHLLHERRKKKILGHHH